MSSSLRQRQRQRREILDYEIQEKKNDKRISAASKGASGVVLKVYAGLLLFLIFMVMSVISWFRPFLLPWNAKPVPKLVLASFFPPFVNKRRDLPTVVGSYAICTPTNLKTRQAIQYTIQQRRNLYSRQLKVIWFVWEQERADQFVMNRATNLCGDGFLEIYEYSPLELQHDLMLWCLLREGSVDGLVEYGMDFDRSLPPQYRNLVVQRVGEERILPSLLVSYPTSVSRVPSNMLTWLMEYAESLGDWDESKYRQDSEEHLFKLIKEEESVAWTLYDAVCGDKRTSFDSSQSSKM
jgi:hypothetical protein